MEKDLVYAFHISVGHVGACALLLRYTSARRKLLCTTRFDGVDVVPAENICGPVYRDLVAINHAMHCASASWADISHTKTRMNSVQ